MKTRLIYLITAILFVNAQVDAQDKRLMLDTINLLCTSQVEVKIAAYDIAVLKKNDSVTVLLADFRKHLKVISQSIPEGNYKLVYFPGKSITIERLNAVNRFTIEGDSLSEYRRNNQCEIVTETFHLLLYFDGLTDIMSDELERCIADGVKMLPEKNRYALTYYYGYTNGVMSGVRPAATNGFAYDMLNVSPEIGVLLVKNTPVVDFRMEIGANFNKKGILRNGYYLAYNGLCTFGDSAGKPRLNEFLDLGFRINRSNDPFKTSWIGAEIGFPTRKRGDYFDDLLFRLGVRWELSKSIRISGQIYVEKQFKLAYPGLRVGFAF